MYHDEPGAGCSAQDEEIFTNSSRSAGTDPHTRYSVRAQTGLQVCSGPREFGDTRLLNMAHDSTPPPEEAATRTVGAVTRSRWPLPMRGALPPAQGPLEVFVHHNTLHAFRSCRFIRAKRCTATAGRPLLPQRRGLSRGAASRTHPRHRPTGLPGRGARRTRVAAQRSALAE